MISLFDYLGHAAGSKLGKRVADYARLKNIVPQKRYVTNTKYTGDVLLYPKEFLDEYFQAEQIFFENSDFVEINTQLMEDSYKIADEENNDRIF